MRGRAFPAVVLLISCSRASTVNTPQPQGVSLGDTTRAQPAVIMRAVTVPESFTPERGDAAIRAFRPAVLPADSAGDCNATRSAGSGALRVSARFFARDSSVTTVTLWFDSVGTLVRYNESRGWRLMLIRPRGGITPAQRDSTVQRSLDDRRMTTIGMDWTIDDAMATNRGGGKPAEAIYGTVRQFENLPALGPPLERIRIARRLCSV